MIVAVALVAGRGDRDDRVIVVVEVDRGGGWLSSWLSSATPMPTSEVANNTVAIILAARCRPIAGAENRRFA
jgi:hypothetical protein